MSLISSICCVWTCRNQCSQNSKKRQTRDGKEKDISKTSDIFDVWYATVLNVVLCREREWERMWGGDFWNDAKVLSSPTDPVWNRLQLLPLQFTPIPAATWETVCRERELVMMWINECKKTNACCAKVLIIVQVVWISWLEHVIYSHVLITVSSLFWPWASSGLCVMPLLLLLSP